MTQIFKPTRAAPPLPGVSLLGLNATSLLELGDAVQRGLSTDALERFAAHLGLPVSEVLTLLGLPHSTYFGYKRRGRTFGADTGAQLYRLARVTQVAEQYFESVTLAHAWLQAPRATFAQRTPLQFALLPGGDEYVVTVLGRLEHGVYS